MRRRLALTIGLGCAAAAATGCARTPEEGRTPSTKSALLETNDADGATAKAFASRDAAPERTDAERASNAADAGPSPSRREDATDPFGHARVSARTACAALAEHVSERDMRTSFVDGNDLLAIANRSPTGALAPDWAPADLVDVRNGKAATASECEKLHCLRREAASALGELMTEMKRLGFPGHVESAFRSYGFQCGTFLTWAKKGGFCDATEQSALPGHSQHQLGTTVDLFTDEWAKDPRGVFREGFGCTPAGKFLREHAWDFGFVMPYPLHPDDRHPKQSCVSRWDIPVNINPRTGYRFEHWHIRYVGKEAASRFAKAWTASGPGTPNELTVEQWLRAEHGLRGADAELPVCDGCNCGACSTLALPGQSTCDDRRKGRSRERGPGALHLDAQGKPLPAESSPAIDNVSAARVKKWQGNGVEVKLTVPDGVTTQPPIVGTDAAGYGAGATFEKLAPYPATEPRAFPPLDDAWVVAVEPVPNDTGAAWPYRAALTYPPVGRIYNRANVVLPARAGALTVKVPVPASVTHARVVLLQGGVPRGQPREVDLRTRE